MLPGTTGYGRVLTGTKRAVWVDMNKVPRPDLDTLETRYGLVVGGRDLTRLLGFSTQGAFKRAKARGSLPIRVFAIEGRRGTFAMVSDVAAWAESLKRAPPGSSPAEPPK